MTPRQAVHAITHSILLNAARAVALEQIEPERYVQLVANSLLAQGLSLALADPSLALELLEGGDAFTAEHHGARTPAEARASRQAATAELLGIAREGATR